MENGNQNGIIPNIPLGGLKLNIDTIKHIDNTFTRLRPHEDTIKALENSRKEKAEKERINEERENYKVELLEQQVKELQNLKPEVLDKVLELAKLIEGNPRTVTNIENMFNNNKGNVQIIGKNSEGDMSVINNITNNSGVSNEDFVKFISETRDFFSMIGNGELIEEMEDNLQVVEQEVTSDTPKKGRIKASLMYIGKKITNIVANPILFVTEEKSKEFIQTKAELVIEKLKPLIENFGLDLFEKVADKF